MFVWSESIRLGGGFVLEEIPMLRSAVNRFAIDCNVFESVVLELRVRNPSSESLPAMLVGSVEGKHHFPFLHMVLLRYSTL